MTLPPSKLFNNFHKTLSRVELIIELNIWLINQIWIVLLVMIPELYCTNTREYTIISSCFVKFVFDSSRLQEVIFVYALVKLYNKANIDHSFDYNK